MQTILLNLPNKLIIITHFCLRTIEHNEKWSTCQPNSRHKRIFHASSRTDTWGDIKNTTPSNKRTEGSKPQQDFWTSANGSKLVRLKCHILWFIVQIDGINKVHQIGCFWVRVFYAWKPRLHILLLYTTEKPILRRNFLPSSEMVFSRSIWDLEWLHTSRACEGWFAATKGPR